MITTLRASAGDAPSIAVTIPPGPSTVVLTTPGPATVYVGTGPALSAQNGFPVAPGKPPAVIGGRPGEPATVLYAIATGITEPGYSSVPAIARPGLMTPGFPGPPGAGDTGAFLDILITQPG